MIERGGGETVRITKVKCHADEDMVQIGRVDQVGSNTADKAADFRRRRVGPGVIDVRRDLSGVCRCWCPIVMEVYLFFIAISRAVVMALLVEP